MCQFTTYLIRCKPLHDKKVYSSKKRNAGKLRTPCVYCNYLKIFLVNSKSMGEKLKKKIFFFISFCNSLQYKIKFTGPKFLIVLLQEPLQNSKRYGTPCIIRVNLFFAYRHEENGIQDTAMA